MVLGYHHSRKQPYETENGSEDISKMVRLVQGLNVGTLKYIVHWVVGYIMQHEKHWISHQHTAHKKTSTHLPTTFLTINVFFPQNDMMKSTYTYVHIQLWKFGVIYSNPSFPLCFCLKTFQIFTAPHSNQATNPPRHRIILEDLNHTGPLAPNVADEFMEAAGSDPFLFTEMSPQTIASASLGQVAGRGLMVWGCRKNLAS